MKKQSYKINWKVSEYRDKQSGALSPVKRSSYVQQLFDMGVGKDEQQTTRKLGR